MSVYFPWTNLSLKLASNTPDWFGEIELDWMNPKHISMEIISAESPYMNGTRPKVEGAKTNTPPKTNTYNRLPITNTLYLEAFPMV